jgi:predicted dehydrogenase
MIASASATTWHDSGPPSWRLYGVCLEGEELMPKTRVAFIGAGSLANAMHYPSVTSLPDVEVAAIAELNPERAQKTAQKYGVPRTYADYKHMLDEVDPQAVYVIMPPQFLFEPVTYVLQQGRALFIEKPPALTTDQASLFAGLAEQHHCITQVGFQRRHVPAMVDLKRRVEERGPIHTVSVSFLKSTRDLTRHPGLYNGVIDPLRCDGIHAVDTLRWLAGGEPTRVDSSTRRLYVPGPFDNAITAQVTFDTGATGLLHFSYVTGRRIFRAEFHGQNATAYVDPDKEAYFVAGDGPIEEVSSSSYGEGPDRPETWLGFWHEHRYFIDRVNDGQQAHCNLPDAVKSMELVDSIYRAG